MWSAKRRPTPRPSRVAFSPHNAPLPFYLGCGTYGKQSLTVTHAWGNCERDSPMPQRNTLQIIENLLCFVRRVAITKDLNEHAQQLCPAIRAAFRDFLLRQF